jgi:hypothetical protein
LWTGIRHVEAGLSDARGPQIPQAVEQLSARLPANATVFGPLVFAGIVARRPDLHFFSYHALSTRPGWNLPPCEDISSTIRTLVQSDPRSNPAPLTAPVDRVFFVRWEFEDFLQYFRAMYANATAGDLVCLFGPSKPEILKTCGADAARCLEVDLVSRAVDTNPVPQPLSDTVRVRAGATPYVDSRGLRWSEDTAWQEGSTFPSTAPVSGTPDPSLYQIAQVSTRGTLTHRFRVPNGNYRVVLKFAETYFTTAGMTIFDVVINGKIEKPRLDIFAEAGGANRALDLQYPATVTDGVLTIALQSIVGNPKICAIELTPSNPRP